MCLVVWCVWAYLGVDAPGPGWASGASQNRPQSLRAEPRASPGEGRVPPPDLQVLFPSFSQVTSRQRGWEGEREGEESIGCLSRAPLWEPPSGNLAPNPGLCPDWEWNRQPFGSQAGAQSADPHQPGLWFSFCGKETFLTISGRWGVLTQARAGWAAQTP